MAIIEHFYNNDRARDIRELLNSNFDNVAKYIPNNFLILTTIERQNLTDDYKTHFKLVFDKETERVYKWSEIKRNWEQYLIVAKDLEARAEAATNRARAFADAEVGIMSDGTENPYTITFFNRDGTPVNSIYLTATNIEFNDENSVKTIIQQLLDDLKSLDSFVGNRDDILNNSDITAKTVCGAIKEINNKAISNKNRLDNIENGTTKVPEAIHSEHADLADVATQAEDSELLNGQPSSYYATKEGLDRTNQDLTETKGRVSKNESDIVDLQTKTDNTNRDVANLTTRVDTHDDKINMLSQLQKDQGNIIDSMDTGVQNLKTQLGWEILLS